jgi:hypothetical protein
MYPSNRWPAPDINAVAKCHRISRGEATELYMRHNVEELMDQLEACVTWSARLPLGDLIIGSNK